MTPLPNDKILFSLLDRYGLSLNEKEELLSIIGFIYNHDEFQRRMTDEFMHHGTLTLGEHILETTIVSFIIAKRHIKKNNLNLTLKTSMFHDLYTIPWQNSPIKDQRFINKHGFRHPIEAVINANTWFPEAFIDEKETEIIIDGIIHHMFPFPVQRYIDSSSNALELRNFEKTRQMSATARSYLIQSSNKGRIGDISLALSAYNEGIITCCSDKITSIKNLQSTDINGLIALITGKNKTLERLKIKKDKNIN